MVINAIKRHFRSHGLLHTLRLTSTGGRQASHIDGQTCAHLIRQSKNSTAPPNVTELQKEWDPVTTIVKDEISLESSESFMKMSDRVNVGKSASEDSIMGNIDYIGPQLRGRLPSTRIEETSTGVGDYHQLPAVGGRATYKYSKKYDELRDDLFLQHVVDDLRKTNPKYRNTTMETVREEAHKIARGRVEYPPPRLEDLDARRGVPPCRPAQSPPSAS